MRFSYRNEFSDYLKQHELHNESAYARLRARHYSALLLPAGLGIAGALGTFPQNPALSFVIMGFLVLYLARALSYRKLYDRSIGEALRKLPEKDITLEVRSDGLLEGVEGIESFCPWGSIEYFQVFQGDLFLVLKSNLSAIVPSRFLTQPGASMSDLVSVLRSHSVEEKI